MHKEAFADFAYHLDLLKDIFQYYVKCIEHLKVDQQNNVDTKSMEDKIIDDCLLKQTPMPEVLPEITDVHDIC
ncbi:hypothetical protein C1645_823382 [Glomus cerebriforme]|uniref:Uncharacterized protein n=1 Tax=Glomus cerebriforme TaxID=658196 RepID=A0A397T2C2_9GLOM|nr:hypothetical protein C1645_823382 [Glomus cerebriforme]